MSCTRFPTSSAPIGRSFAGRRTHVVGAGHWAANTLINLDSLAKEAPGRQMSCAIRNGSTVRLPTGAADDFAARGQLGAPVNGPVASGQLDQIASFEIDDVQHDGDEVTVTGRRAHVQ